MDFTKNFVKSKNPCADGYRWYLRHHAEGSDYQQLLDDLVAAGRVEDACWLLDKVGPTQAVLRLDRLDCAALVFAGTLEVRGSIDVDTVLRAGGAIRCGGAIRAGERLVAGEGIKAAGGVHCGGEVRCGGALLTGWHSHVAGALVADQLKCDGSLSCGEGADIAGAAFVRTDLHVGGACAARSLTVGGSLHAVGDVRTVQGLICGEGLACGGHLEAGWGIKCGGDLVAGRSVRAGEGLAAAGEIRAGPGYGVFAGLCVQSVDWPTSARVTARVRPAGLLSGAWIGPSGQDVGCPGGPAADEHGRALTVPAR